MNGAERLRRTAPFYYQCVMGKIVRKLIRNVIVIMSEIRYNIYRKDTAQTGKQGVSI